MSIFCQFRAFDDHLAPLTDQKNSFSPPLLPLSLSPSHSPPLPIEFLRSQHSLSQLCDIMFVKFELLIECKLFIFENYAFKKISSANFEAGQ
jgi:hypothetical protein